MQHTYVLHTVCPIKKFCACSFVCNIHAHTKTLLGEEKYEEAGGKCVGTKFSSSKHGFILETRCFDSVELSPQFVSNVLKQPDPLALQILVLHCCFYWYGNYVWIVRAMLSQSSACSLLPRVPFCITPSEHSPTPEILFQSWHTSLTPSHILNLN